MSSSVRNTADSIKSDLHDNDTAQIGAQNVNSLQDSKRLGFAKSFNRLSMDASQLAAEQPEAINEKLKNTFVEFCSVVERGVNDALMTRFNLIHGVTASPSASAEKLGSGNFLSKKGGSVTEPDSKTLSPKTLNGLPKSGSMASLSHSRAASRSRLEGPGLKHNRNLHRAPSARVRSAGKCAACYLSKEESYKLRLTIEARIRCAAVAPKLPALPIRMLNLETASNNSSPNLKLISQSKNSASQSSIESADGVNGNLTLTVPQENSTNRFRGLTKSHSQSHLNTEDLTPLVPTIEEQARDIRNAISAIVSDMPEPIPGTPIIIVFNAIVYHDNGDGGGAEEADFALAFSWKSETSTPCGAMIKELRQQRMELAYREQGVELDSVKAEAAAAAAAIAEQNSILGKIKGLFKVGSSKNLKSKADPMAE
ncbi:hypothetical protein HK100_001354 [Physocladia obscura]|uniref:Uncharacterized protein n=1 Tax=Physocladia obscura TaxID=109957 RepID=A0AAD5XBW5_9FUNG|nr:hypothetical protein HK100_001354 [Physocladia obscura]